MNKHLVHLVCSPRPRVGKTLVARLLLENFMLSDPEATGFDTNMNEPAFAEHFPDHVTAADIRTVQGQVTLFDGLLIGNGSPKVVDLWHRDFERFLELVGTIDFLAEARARGVASIFYFIDDLDPLSERAHADLRDRYADVSIISVRNDAASGSNAVTGPRTDLPNRFRDEPRLQIPPLDPILRRIVDEPGVSLAAFLRGDPMPHVSIVVRAAVRAWTSKVFMQLHDFELRRQMAGAEYLR